MNREQPGMAWQNGKQKNIVLTLLRVLVVLVLAVSYPVALWLPDWVGWENGPVENTQALVLFLGFVAALIFAARSHGATQTGSPVRLFWIMVAPVWLILCVRELSWGAVFMPPLLVDPETGPVFSSSAQLWYKPAVYPAVGVLVLGCVVVFAWTRQYRTLSWLWRFRKFPLFELTLALIGAVLSTAAEGHGGLQFLQHLGHGQQQIIEEVAELGAYLAVFTAQWRVWLALCPMSGMTSSK